MFDHIVLTIVWLSGAALLLIILLRINALPRTGDFWIHLKKFEFLVLLAGAACIVLSPLYGWSWSMYGGHLITVAIAMVALTKVVRSVVVEVTVTLDHIFDVLED